MSTELKPPIIKVTSRLLIKVLIGSTADHGNLYEKKYLINAKWWREWKDFVNFDAEEDELTQSNEAEKLFY